LPQAVIFRRTMDFRSLLRRPEQRQGQRRRRNFRWRRF
jgi:hypothetical protein